MQPFQTMVGDNGYENFLFPMPYLYMTQGYHSGLYIDIVGYDGSKVISQAPLYAPFTMKCVYVGSLATNEPTCCWESLDTVNFVNGEVDYACISVSHDDNFASYKVGDTRNQGEIFAHTGTTGIATGDHCHMAIGKGKFKGYHTIADAWQLVNVYLINEGIGMNDTDIIHNLGFTWFYFPETTPPKITKRSWIPLSSCGALWGIKI